MTHPRAILLLAMLTGGLHAAGPPAEPSALPRAVTERLRKAHAEWLEAARAAEEGDLKTACRRGAASAAVQREALGDHPRSAALLWVLAGWHERAGDWAAARRARAAVTAILVRVHGADHHRVTDARIAEADTRRDEALGADGRARLAALRRAAREARVRSHKGDLAGAVAPLEKVVADLPGLVGKDHPELAEALGALAWVLREMGEYARCEPLLVRARAALRAGLGERHPRYAEGVQNLAALYWSLRDYRRAEPLFVEALAIQKALVGEEDVEYARTLANLAQLYKDTGRYARSRDLSLRALGIRRALLPEGDPDVLLSLHNLAGLYVDLGDIDGAIERYQKVLALRREHLGRDHPEVAFTLNNLAEAYHRLGDSRRCRRMYEEALALLNRRLGPRHALTTMTRANLASVLLDLGEADEARKILEQTLKLVREREGVRHPDHAHALNNLAVLYWSTGDARRALPLFEQALKQRFESLGERAPGYVAALENVATQHLTLGDAPRAEPLYREALSLSRQRLEDTFAVLSERQRLDLLGRLQLSLHLYLGAARAADAPAARLYEAVLAWKGAAAARAEEERAARGEPALAPLFTRLQAARVRLAALGANTPRPADEGRWLAAFKKVEAEKEETEAAIARGSAGFRLLGSRRRAAPADVSAALPEGAGLVDFIEYEQHLSLPPRKGGPAAERRLLAFVLRRGLPVRCVGLGPSAPIARAVKVWRDALERGEGGAEAASEVRRRVWLPLGRSLGVVSAVIVAADGAVSHLPFAALPGARPGTCLIEEVAIGHITAGRDLLPGPGRARAAGGLLTLGGADHGGRGRWADLPGTRVEVARVADLWRGRAAGPVAVLRGEGAGKADLLRALGDAPPRWLHLATHGFFEEAAEGRPVSPAVALGMRETMTLHRNPLLSCGLALARANVDAEGLLTGEEIAGLDLRGCELAVLSACGTGLGRVASGEGVLGLQRAFRLAGARSVLYSLWSVNDAATSVLMEEFYARLWGKEKLAPLEALRQAQLAVLRRPELVAARQKVLAGTPGLRGAGKASEVIVAGRRERRSPPAWWGAWQLSGDWR